MFWNQFYDIVYKSNDMKTNDNVCDHDEELKKEKRRPLRWGRNKPETIQDVYVCIETARRRKKRTRAMGDDSQQFCQYVNEDMAVTPIKKNIRSIKRSFSFIRLGGYEDEDHVANESFQASSAHPDATIDKNGNLPSVVSQGSSSINMSGASLTPLKPWEKRLVKGEGLAENGVCARKMSFESTEGNFDRMRLRANGGGLNSRPDEDGSDGNSNINTGGHDRKNLLINEDDSAVSFTSTSLNEQYSSAIIRISQDSGGEIVFEYPNREKENGNDKDMHAVESLVATKNGNDGIDAEDHSNQKTDYSFLDDITMPSSLSNDQITPNDLNTNLISTATAPIMTSENGLRRRHKRNGRGLTSDDDLPTPSFELTATTYKTKEDEIEKELIACFKANNENFTNLNYPVSELILAEVNEEKKLCDNQESDPKKTANGIILNFTSFMDHLKGNDTSTKIPVLEPQKTTESVRNENIVRIKLSKHDEIHVSPCQCALSLVGLRGVTPLDTKVISANDGESMFNNFFSILSSPSESSATGNEGFLKFPFFGRRSDGSGEDLSKRSNDRDDNEQDDSGSSETPLLLTETNKRVASEQQSPLMTKYIHNEIGGKLVRTKSAQAADAEDRNRLIQKKTLKRKSSGVNWSLAHTESGRDQDGPIVGGQEQQKPSGHLAVRRDKRWDYESVGYHEITLIRNQIDDCNDKGNLNPNVNGEFIDWRAVTIRCRDHDELDILIKSLKESSCAKIIPFSSNPKEKLKKPKAKEALECPPKTLSRVDLSVLDDGCASVQERRDSLNSANDHQSKSNSSVNWSSTGTSFSEDDHNMHDKSPTKKVSDKNQQKNILASGNQFITKIPWDFNFNKKAYCELCDLRFTLLTRRHHCRKCERSCCCHCSSMLLVKGGGEKRYCNMCSADILRIQSEALHRRLRKRMSETVLPGKVHPSCHRLGVGVIGKLPHWKNYIGFSAEQRPAVGRLTVEIVEAMALPSVKKGHGIVDPYVRATITGYDRDLFWYLREWLPRKRFSMCSGYCSSTVSPVWRGCGGSGGERLTLPLISTAGAVLRLEVLHYNVMTNARGKDSVLGIVEIPLSDIPNANMRQLEGLEADSSADKSFDGYCDRWYRLLPVDHAKSNTVTLSKPIANPHSEKSSDKDKDLPGNNVIKSLEEIGKHVQELFIAPVEWFASAIKLDLPARRPEVICEEHRARSTIHVRIKLNASHVGDLLSHAWFPPVKPHPSYPFDPQLMLNRIQEIIKLLTPYHSIFQYIEDVIKWKHDTKTCLKAYCVFAFHLVLIPHFVYLLHIYLLIFLGVRLRLMNAKATDAHTDEDSPSDSDEDSLSDNSIHRASTIESVESDESTHYCASPTTQSSDQFVVRNSPSLGRELYLRENELPHLKQRECRNLPLKPRKSSSDKDEEEEEETAKLNKAVTWLAKRLGHNKGLDILQFNLTMIERHIRDVSSVWDGSNRLLTQVAILCIIFSLLLHFLVSRRILWLVGTSTWYFAQAPTCKLYARAFLGFWRGVAKTIRRQHLLDAEILEVADVKPVWQE